MRRRGYASAAAALLLAIGWAPGARASEAWKPALRAPVELSVLSYNTHGLRGFFVDDHPETRFPAIGRLINGYDVVLLQEDFAYHESLEEFATHPMRRRGNTQDRNPIADLLAPIVCGDCGAGLSSWVGLREASLTGEHREAYRDYSGWFDARKDAWVTKGLLALRVRLPGGAVVDVYNSHLDAGKKPKRVRDHRTREKQLAQLERAIRRFSGSGAVIVAGDFNAREDRSNPALAGFAAALGLRESGARTDPDRWRPRCEYIFYRGDARTEIALLDAGEASEFADANGAPLSDHPAIRARFQIRARP
ncbi:MAG TPA: endonuclease/exonuclease/phosphatase family protein [Myxococcota bacterium]